MLSTLDFIGSGCWLADLKYIVLHCVLSKAY